MTNSFSILQVAEYLKRLGLKISQVDRSQNTIELAFHDEHGQWQMIVGIHHSGNASKLMLIVPHIGTVTEQKRLECLEALLAVNYRIALGKFGLDLADGEVRLEECIPLADKSIPFEQFRLAFSAIMQTVSIYHDLLPRIIYGHQSAKDALQDCENEFFAQTHDETDFSLPAIQTQVVETSTNNEMLQMEESELDVNEVLEEVARLLGKHQE
ncbi:YbjN domain-containing protein [Dictyobacter kobayashii]|uniref:YbjN domain-containing protein n=1 Tax=Dictyobacter kobayashii TaxID=2014872 RepID=A0A402AMN7_9CHLR|nr:YbjN domain-containing protein [Dictyobacter kobayashii]GCE20352.1 hypothetical protein KDK_41520 [Dictyobacter kobayashii]